MRKLFLLSFLVLAAFAVNAQTDTLQQYTGKYRFPEGSVVSEINVTVESGVLMAGSVMGNTELKKTEGDVFEIVNFGGTATFKRNTEGKIISVRVQVSDVDMEGAKQESGVGAFFTTKYTE
ncbi:MAG: DUF3471 domain-containing protein [Chitinophagaceae bacterium]|nr:DUF3471 domain-containing protein [Chitinophagaceae bacterium]